MHTCPLQVTNTHKFKGPQKSDFITYIRTIKPFPYDHSFNSFYCCLGMYLTQNKVKGTVKSCHISSVSPVGTNSKPLHEPSKTFYTSGKVHGLMMEGNKE